MKVFFTIWISAVLIQEVIPGTLVRLPRHTSKLPARVETEYEAKYEQTGQNGNENSGLFTGKQEIVHDNCADNWNAFADKCAALVKDLVASLASSVSSRPGDATKLQLQIKNTFKHFDNTHNCTCLNNSGKSMPATGLSCLFNNITISTIAPTASNNRYSTGANNEDESNGNNGSGLTDGVVGLESNGDGDDGNGYSDGLDNNLDTQTSYPAGVSQKPNTALDHAKNLGFSPENEGSEAGSGNRRQAEYPQVSWQPGNRARQLKNNQGRSNNISRSPYPFIVTPQPNSAYESPTPATYSDGNNLPNAIGSDGQTNSNVPPAGSSGESEIPLGIQTLPETNTYTSEPASDSRYKGGAGVPTIGSRNSENPKVARVPPAFSDHYRKVPAIPAPGPQNPMKGNPFSKAPVTDDSYDSKLAPIQPVTNELSDSKFPTNNSPYSGSYSNQPQFLPNTPVYTPENSQSNDYPAFSKNQLNNPVAEINQPLSSLAPGDSLSNSISETPNTKPVINSDSNFPEPRAPESQWDTTNPLPIGPNPNPSSTDVKPGSSAIPEVLPASINDDSEHTTNKFGDTISLPLDHVPPSEYVKPGLPEAENHKSADPSEAGHALNNLSDRKAVTPPFLSENFDPLGGTGSENVNGNLQRSAPDSVYPIYITTTMSPLGYNSNVKPEENSNFNTDPEHEDDEDCDEYTDADPASNAETANGATSAALPPIQGVPTVSDSIPQLAQENVLTPHDGDQNTVSSTDPLSTYNSNSNTRTGEDPTIPIAVSPEQSVPSVSDPVVQENLPAPDHVGENTGFENNPNGLSGTSLVGASQVKPVSMVSDPAVQVVPENVPAPDEDEECDENLEPNNDATTPVELSPVQRAPSVSDPAVEVVQGNVPAFDNGGENMGSGNDATIPVSPAQHVPSVSDPTVQAVAGNVPAFVNGDENMEPGNDPNSPQYGTPNTGTGTDPIIPVAEPPEQGVPSGTAEPAVPVVQGNDPAFDNVGESIGSGNEATIPVAVSPVQRAPSASDPAVQGVQGNLPAFDNGDENLRSSNEPNNAYYSPSIRTGNDLTNPVEVPPVDRVPSLEPAVQEVQGNVPPFDNVGENLRSSNEPNNAYYSPNIRAGNDLTNPVEVPPVDREPSVLEPAVQEVQGNVPVFANGDENMGPVNDPNSAYYGSPNIRTSNDPIIPAAVHPEQGVPSVSEPAGQSLQSGGSPRFYPGSGVEGVQNGNSQSSALNVTPLPDTYLPHNQTPISTISEGQSGKPGNEDAGLYEPTTFQTTATDPTSPQSILIPTESTRQLTPASTGSRSSVRHSASPLSKESDDDDEDEDCCSCESCTDEITDPKQYKENACKNLEEARRELKAIFDKIKKTLKCGRTSGLTLKKNVPNQS